EAELPPGRDSVLAPTPPAPKVELRAVPREPAPPPMARAEPAPSPSLAMPMIELPEVGAAPFSETPEATRAEPIPSPSPQTTGGLDDAPVAFDEITIDDVVAEDSTPDDGAIGEAEVADAARDEILVGDVTLSSVLYGILVEEAVQHLATLTHELE